MSFDKQQLPPLYPNGTFNQPKKYEKYSTLPPSDERNLPNIEQNPLQNHAPYQGIPGFDRDFNNNNNNKSAQSSKYLPNNLPNNTTAAAASSAYIHPNATLRSQNTHQNTSHNYQNSQNHQNSHQNFQNHHFTTPPSSSSSDPSQKQHFNQNTPNFTARSKIGVRLPQFGHF